MHILLFMNKLQLGDLKALCSGSLARLDENEDIIITCFQPDEAHEMVHQHMDAKSETELDNSHRGNGQVV